MQAGKLSVCVCVCLFQALHGNRCQKVPWHLVHEWGRVQGADGKDHEWRPCHPWAAAWAHLDPARSVSPVSGWGGSILHVLFCLTWTQPDLWVQSLGGGFHTPCFVLSHLDPARSVSPVSGGRGGVHAPQLHVCSASQLLYTARSVSPVPRGRGWGGFHAPPRLFCLTWTQPDLWVQSVGGVHASPCFVLSHLDPARSVSAVCWWGSILLHVCCVSCGPSQICECSLLVGFYTPPCLLCLMWTQPDLWVLSVGGVHAPPCLLYLMWTQPDLWVLSVGGVHAPPCLLCLMWTQPDLWVLSVGGVLYSSMFVVSHNCCTQPDLWVRSLDGWGPCSSMFVVSHNCCTQPDLWVQSRDGWGPCSSVFVVSHVDPVRSLSPVCGWDHAPSYLFCLRTHVHSLMYVTGSV